jgi:PAS domain S-box-containing protein
MSADRERKTRRSCARLATIAIVNSRQQIDKRPIRGLPTRGASRPARRGSAHRSEIRTESADREDASRARALLVAQAVGICRLDVDGRPRTANQRLADLVGCPREALRGRRVEEVLDSPELAAQLGRRDRGEDADAWRLEVLARAQRWDGGPAWLRIAGNAAVQTLGQTERTLAERQRVVRWQEGAAAAAEEARRQQVDGTATRLREWAERSPTQRLGAGAPDRR